MRNELPELKCLTCDAVFSVIYNRSWDTEGGVKYCPFCGAEWDAMEPGAIDQ